MRHHIPLAIAIYLAGVTALPLLESKGKLCIRMQSKTLSAGLMGYTDSQE